MDEEYVDLVGLSTVRSNQHIIGETDGNDGVITQEVEEVRIENLTVELSGSSGDAAYYPTGENFDETIVRNCEFIAASGDSMRVGIEYQGVFENCKAGENSFGGGSGGEASGSFIQCIGGDGSFGGAGGTASGTFRDCIGGQKSFGGDTDGGDGSNAVFFNCEGGAYSFGVDGYCAICMTNGKPSSGYRMSDF